MKISSLQHNNKGLSLVELVVVILMMGFISLMLVVFVSTSRSSYQVVSTEISLQEEAGYALGYIQDVAIEAYECSDKYIINDGASDLQVFYILAPDSKTKLKSDMTYYYFIVLEQDDEEEPGELRFIRLAAGSGSDAAGRDPDLSIIGSTVNVEETFKNLKNSGRQVSGDVRKLLSQYVKSMTVSVPSGKNIIDIEIVFELMDETYVAHKVISGRNM
jgi:hypothetical protein